MLSFLVLASAIGQAQFNLVLPVSIAQITDIELGDVYNTAHSRCVLTTTSRKGDGCAASDSALGKLKLQGSEGQSVLIKVSSAYNSYVEFTPILPNGSQQQLFSLSMSTPIFIGGEIKVKPNESVGPASISYLIEINYQ